MRISLDPAARLVGIAGGVQRGPTEIDAAIEKPLEIRHEPRHLMRARFAG